MGGRGGGGGNRDKSDLDIKKKGIEKCEKRSKRQDAPNAYMHGSETEKEVRSIYRKIGVQHFFM